MTFKKYNHTNNAFCELLTDLQSSDTTMMLTGNFNRLPTSNFIVKISKYQGTKCVARENVYVANRNNNICTGLIRAYEKVPMDDDATEGIQQALNFSAGDMVECVVSSEIIKDLQDSIFLGLHKKYTTQLLVSSTQAIWTKIGNFSGRQGSRFYMKIMGGQGYNANNPNSSEIIECLLTLGNENHSRNFSGFWSKRFYTNSIISSLRVVKINNLSWDIYINNNAGCNGSMIDICHSGEFSPLFSEVTAPNISGDTVYNISEKVVGGVDFNSLSEITNINNNDFFLIKDSSGNKKVKFSNLNKLVLPKNKQVDVTSTSLSIPNGAMVNLGVFVDSGGAPTVIKGVKLLYSTDNSTWSEFCVMGGVRGAMVRSFFVPSGFIKIEETNNTDWRSSGTTWAVAQLL